MQKVGPAWRGPPSFINELLVLKLPDISLSKLESCKSAQRVARPPLSISPLQFSPALMPARSDGYYVDRTEEEERKPGGDPLPAQPKSRREIIFPFHPSGHFLSQQNLSLSLSTSLPLEEENVQKSYTLKLLLALFIGEFIHYCIPLLAIIINPQRTIYARAKTF